MLESLSDAILARKWHWYGWHAENFKHGSVTQFFAELMMALTVIDDAMPGSARAYVDRIASIADEDRNQAHYDQLQQILSELDVLQYTVARPWPKDTEFFYEPAVVAGGVNPEAIVRTGSFDLGIEVKAPRIREWRNAMPLGVQAVGRAVPQGAIQYDTLPRDNPVKDAVAGADRKFRSLRAKYPDLLGVMVLVWDGFMNEPISALANPGSGLFTVNTFDPEKRTFTDLDAVLVLPHLSQHIEGPGNRNFQGVAGTFHWPRFPVLPYLINPASPRASRIGAVIEATYNAEDQRGLRLLGSEYGETDFVFWIDATRNVDDGAE